MYVHVHGGALKSLDVFHCYCPPYVFKLGLLLNRKLTKTALETCCVSTNAIEWLVAAGLILLDGALVLMRNPWTANSGTSVLWPQ